MTNKIRISLSKEEIGYLIDAISTIQTKTKQERFVVDFLRLKLQEAGIKLMFGKVEE